MSPEYGHSISEIEQSSPDLQDRVGKAPELSRMIRPIESPRPNGTLFGKNKNGVVHVAASDSRKGEAKTRPVVNK